MCRLRSEMDKYKFCGSGFPSIPDGHGRAGLDHAQEAFGIPIGEAEAAVRFRFSDVLRAGCAVHAIAGQVEADPRQAYGIVGAGWNEQFPRDARCSALARE